LILAATIIIASYVFTLSGADLIFVCACVLARACACGRHIITEDSKFTNMAS